MTVHKSNELTSGFDLLATTTTTSKPSTPDVALKKKIDVRSQLAG